MPTAWIGLAGLCAQRHRATRPHASAPAGVPVRPANRGASGAFARFRTLAAAQGRRTACSRRKAACFSGTLHITTSILLKNQEGCPRPDGMACPARQSQGQTAGQGQAGRAATAAFRCESVPNARCFAGDALPFAASPATCEYAVGKARLVPAPPCRISRTA